jgi:hypothetical protein
MSKYTISQFAKKIRDKHPGSYDDLTDNQLVNLWLEKHPKDKHFIYIDEDEDDEGNYEDEDDGGDEDSICNDSNTSRWVLIIISIIVLFFTNPSLEKHKDKAANEAMAVFKESKVYGMLNSFSFGKGDELILNSIKGGTHRNNYFLFSLTTMQLSKENETTTIGIGILGVVYIFDDAKQELKSQIDSYDSAAGLFLGS